MGIVYKIFYIGFRQMFRDGMLLMLIFAPFLMGSALYFLLPIADGFVQQQFDFSLSSYFPLSDALLITMTPVMTAMICAFVMLDERDEGVGVYYRITPKGGYAYLMARIGLPMIWAFISTIIVASLFSLVIDDPLIIVFSALIATIQGVCACMLLVTLASNKVEGLALAKLTNFFVLGFVFSWFIESPIRYVFGILPGFWLGELMKNMDLNSLIMLPNFLMGVLMGLVGILVLMRLFVRRIY